MTPIVDRLEAEFAGEVDVVRLNVEESENEAIQRSYELRGHPTFAVLDGDGRKTAQFFGIVEEDTLRAALHAINDKE